MELRFLKNLLNEKLRTLYVIKNKVDVPQNEPQLLKVEKSNLTEIPSDENIQKFMTMSKLDFLFRYHRDLDYLLRDHSLDS